MDMQKEREAFEQLPEINQWIDALKYGEKTGVYIAIDNSKHDGVANWVNGAWFMWQAKAQAVPDGFALVSQKDLLELTIAINAVDLATHTESKTNEVREMWQQVALKLMALGAAQEPK